MLLSPAQWAPDFLRTNSKKEHQSEMGLSIPAATRATLEETKEAGNMQSLLFPSPGEKSRSSHPENLGGRRGGMREWAESSSREQAEPRHSNGQPCTTGNLLRENTLLCVCAALLTGLRDQTQGGTTSPTLGFFETLSHYKLASNSEPSCLSFPILQAYTRQAFEKS